MVYFNPRTIERDTTTAAALKTASKDNATSFISGYGRLRGLQQAILILKCVEGGFRKEAILEMCKESDGDNIRALGVDRVSKRYPMATRKERKR